MSKKFIQLTSGWIPVSVLLLFAAALVTGQPGGTQAAGAASLSKGDAPLQTVLDVRLLREELDSVRYYVDSIIQLPDGVELAIDATILSPHGKTTEQSDVPGGY